MRIFKKILFLCLLFLAVVSPINVFALENNEDKIFKAKVIEILEEHENENKKQQNLKLIGLENEFKNKEIEFNGIGDIEVLKSNIYEVGDKVLVALSYGFEGEENFYIVDYVRTKFLLILSLLFFIILIIVGRMKGFRSILALTLTFLVIIKYIIPQILSGANPLFVTIIGSLIILIIIIYITEGFNSRSHISSISIFISLIFTVFCLMRLFL
ncbi:MAG: YibE/F family protein [Candidatus Falkowbacteria bacterium]